MAEVEERHLRTLVNIPYFHHKHDVELVPNISEVHETTRAPIEPSHMRRELDQRLQQGREGEVNVGV